MRKCSKCYGAYYCDKTCFKADWKEHKTRCMEPLDLGIATDVDLASNVVVSFGADTKAKVDDRLVKMSQQSKWWFLPLASIDNPTPRKSGTYAISLDVRNVEDIPVLLKTSPERLYYADEVDHLPVPVRYYFPFEETDGGMNFATMALTSTSHTSNVVAAFGIDMERPDPIGATKYVV